MTARIPSRRSFVVGPAFAVGDETIDEAPDIYVAHVGDPPFVARIADAEDVDEPLIECGDGMVLADLVWLTPKRANGRLLDSLLAAAADAVAAFDTPGEDDEDEAGELDPEDARGLAAQVLKSAARAGQDRIPVLGFASEADYRRVMGEGSDAIMPWSFYSAYVEALEALAPERSLSVLRVVCDPARYETWLREADRENTPEARLDYMDELVHAEGDDD